MQLSQFGLESFYAIVALHESLGDIGSFNPLRDVLRTVRVRVGELPDSALVAIKVGMTRRVVCGSPAYFSAHGILKSPDALSAHRCILFEWLMAQKGWTFEVNGVEVNVAVRPRLVVNTSEAAIDAAIAGLGLTRVLCYQIAAARRAGLLELALEKFEPALYPINLVCAAQGVLPIKLRAFLDFAAPRLKTAVAQGIH